MAGGNIWGGLRGPTKLWLDRIGFISLLLATSIPVVVNSGWESIQELVKVSGCVSTFKFQHNWPLAVLDPNPLTFPTLFQRQVGDGSGLDFRYFESPRKRDFVARDPWSPPIHGTLRILVDPITEENPWVG